MDSHLKSQICNSEILLFLHTSHFLKWTSRLRAYLATALELSGELWWHHAPLNSMANFASGTYRSRLLRPSQSGENSRTVSNPWASMNFCRNRMGFETSPPCAARATATERSHPHSIQPCPPNMECTNPVCAPCVGHTN